MQNAPRPRWLLVGCLLLVVGGGACVWVATTLLQPQRLVLNRVEAELAAASPDELPAKLAQFAAFGDDGVPYLARALRHERPEVTEEARAVLSVELDRWQLLSERAAARRLALLARCLAEDIENCAPPVRLASADLATRMLLFPLETTAPANLLDDCERILLHARRDRDEPPTDRVASRTMLPPLAPDAVPLDDALQLPGGDLPHELTGVPSLPPGERAQPRPLPADDEPDLTPIVTPEEEPRELPGEISRSSASEPDLASDSSTDTLALIRGLASASTSEREAAEDTLRQRGFGEAHLAVARQFASPSVDVRRRLVERLAQQRVVEPLPWLLHLLADSDAGVRLAAAHVLATSNDPQVTRRLRERALVENDLEVRAALQRVMSR